MKIGVIGSILLIALGAAACGGVDSGNGHNSNTAIKANAAGPSTGTVQPNTNAGTTGAANTGAAANSNTAAGNTNSSATNTNR
jgi:hypothetical protein